MNFQKLCNAKKKPCNYKVSFKLMTRNSARVTSSLPMRCATTCATSAFCFVDFLKPCIYYHRFFYLSTINLNFFSRENSDTKTVPSFILSSLFCLQELPVSKPQKNPYLSGKVFFSTGIGNKKNPFTYGKVKKQ